MHDAERAGTPSLRAPVWNGLTVCGNWRCVSLFCVDEEELLLETQGEGSPDGVQWSNREVTVVFEAGMIPHQQ